MGVRTCLQVSKNAITQLPEKVDVVGNSNSFLGNLNRAYLNTIREALASGL